MTFELRVQTQGEEETINFQHTSQNKVIGDETCKLISEFTYHFSFSWAANKIDNKTLI